MHYCADLHMVDLQQGEELVEASTQHGDRGRLQHKSSAPWRWSSSLQGPQQAVIGPVWGLVDWKRLAAEDKADVDTDDG